MELAAFLSMNIPDIDDPNIPSLLPGGGEVLSATDPDISIPIWLCIPGTSVWGSRFSCIPWGRPCDWCSMVEADECPPCWSGGHWEPNRSWNWLLLFIIPNSIFELFKILFFFFFLKLFYGEIKLFSANDFLRMRIEFALLFTLVSLSFLVFQSIVFLFFFNRLCR